MLGKDILEVLNGIFRLNNFPQINIFGKSHMQIMRLSRNGNYFEVLIF